MRILIIGGTGFIGYHALKEALKRGHEVSVLALPPVPADDLLPQNVEITLSDLNTLSERAEVALCCLPHRVSMQFVPQLLSAGVKVVDFSADYRIHDVALYERVYQVEHTDKENLPRAAFGLPELFRQTIPQADLVANPGCYPTAAALALAPLVKENLIDPTDIVVNAVSGTSGAGRKAAAQAGR